MDHDSITVMINVTERDLPHRTKVMIQVLKMDEQEHLKLVRQAIGLMIDPLFGLESPRLS
jgi:hypothetical protein